MLFFPLAAMAENNRLKLTASVIKAFGTIMSAHRGEVPCSITTAKVVGDKPSNLVLP